MLVYNTKIVVIGAGQAGLSAAYHLRKLAIQLLDEITEEGPQTGGVLMEGRLATKVAKDPRIHLVGYGPSASTIGANRAGRAAAQELCTYLNLL